MFYFPASGGRIQKISPTLTGASCVAKRFGGHMSTKKDAGTEKEKLETKKICDSAKLF